MFLFKYSSVILVVYLGLFAGPAAAQDLDEWMGLIDELNHPSPRIRERALDRLRSGYRGEAGNVRLLKTLKRLFDRQSEQRQEEIRQRERLNSEFTAYQRSLRRLKNTLQAMSQRYEELLDRGKEQNHRQERELTELAVKNEHLRRKRDALKKEQWIWWTRRHDIKVKLEQEIEALQNTMRLVRQWRDQHQPLRFLGLFFWGGLPRIKDHLAGLWVAENLLGSKASERILQKILREGQEKHAWAAAFLLLQTRASSVAEAFFRKNLSKRKRIWHYAEDFLKRKKYKVLKPLLKAVLQGPYKNDRLRALAMLQDFPEEKLDLLIMSRPRKISPETRRIKEMLEKEKMTLDFHETPLPQFVDFLRSTLAINIIIAPEVFKRSPEQLKITCRVHHLPPGDILDLLLPMYRLGYRIQDSIILIDTPENLRAPVDRLYHVGDIMLSQGANAQKYLRQLMTVCGPHLSFSILGNMLRVTATGEEHRRFSDDLSLLRRIGADTIHLQAFLVELAEKDRPLFPAGPKSQVVSPEKGKALVQTGQLLQQWNLRTRSGGTFRFASRTTPSEPTTRMTFKAAFVSQRKLIADLSLTEKIPGLNRWVNCKAGLSSRSIGIISPGFRPQALVRSY